MNMDDYEIINIEDEVEAATKAVSLVSESSSYRNILEECT